MVHEPLEMNSSWIMFMYDAWTFNGPRKIGSWIALHQFLIHVHEPLEKKIIE